MIRKAGYDISKAIEILAEKEGISKEELMKKLQIEKMTGLGYV